jgi:hypothetical protein
MAARLVLLIGLGTLLTGSAGAADPAGATTEQWGIFEAVFQGPANGNPFIDVQLTARFTNGGRTLEASGFYDGEGTYRVRFMPDRPGSWEYRTRSNRPELDGKTGTFPCVKPAATNHGPVRVRQKIHFAYADGTPYFPFGTTCYAWVHQGEALEQQTLATLKAAPFNKLRMCIFPKHYDYNHNDPPRYPFARSQADSWDFTRPNPAFFRHLETRVAQLRDLGIEADLILLHPYDRWGFATMGFGNDCGYLRYVVARLGAYRNVWWSMANEWDLMKGKTPADWDKYFQLVRAADPYDHLCSIHNCRKYYDYTKPWVTHVCLQHWDTRQMRQWLEQYGKPVIDDECQYEGNIPWPWGNITAQELVHRFWLATAAGGSCGHGETYRDPGDILWWSKGGVLHGQSPARIAFLRKILEEGSPEGLSPMPDSWVWDHVAGGQRGDYRLFYFGEHQPHEWSIGVPQKTSFKVAIIDTWNMTVTPQDKVYPPGARIELPGKPYLAVRITPVGK